jgi:hypothetical protein
VGGGEYMIICIKLGANSYTKFCILSFYFISGGNMKTQS